MTSIRSLTGKHVRTTPLELTGFIYLFMGGWGGGYSKNTVIINSKFKGKNLILVYQVI